MLREGLPFGIWGGDIWGLAVAAVLDCPSRSALRLFVMKPSTLFPACGGNFGPSNGHNPKFLKEVRPRVSNQGPPKGPSGGARTGPFRAPAIFSGWVRGHPGFQPGAKKQNREPRHRKTPGGTASKFSFPPGQFPGPGRLWHFLFPPIRRHEGTQKGKADF